MNDETKFVMAFLPLWAVNGVYTTAANTKKKVEKAGKRTSRKVRKIKNKIVY